MLSLPFIIALATNLQLGISAKLFLSLFLLKISTVVLVYGIWRSIDSWLKRFRILSLSTQAIMGVGALGGLLGTTYFAIGNTLLGQTLDKTLLGQAGSSNVWSYYAAGISIGAFWLPLHSLVASSFTRYQHLRKVALHQIYLESNEFNSLKSDEFSAPNSLESRKREFLKSAEAELELLSRRIENYGLRHPLIPVQIREAARRLSRVSFDYGSHSPNILSRVGLLNLFEFPGDIYRQLRSSIKARPLNTQWLLAAMILATFQYSLRADFDSSLPLQLFLVATATLSGHLVGIALFRRNPSKPIMALGIGFILQLGMGVITLYLAYAGLAYSNSVAVAVVQMFVGRLTVLTFFGYLAQAGLLSVSEIESEIRLFGASKREMLVANSNVGASDINWERYLHGHVQSRLNAAALVLSNSQIVEDEDAMNRALNEVRTSLTVVDFVELDPNRVLLQEVNRLAKLWDGILVTDIEIESRGAQDKYKNLDLIIGLIEEGLSNAVRHGEATEARIKISQFHDRRTKVFISDNGNEIDQVEKGAGSRLFDHATKGRWTLERNQTNTRTELTLVIIDAEPLRS